MGRVGLLLLVALAGCVSSNAVPCGNGTFCPEGQRCSEGRCLSPDEVVPCDGKADGEPCSVDLLPGECQSGGCVLYKCGDGLVTSLLGEQCDGTNLGVSELNGVKNCIDLGFYLPDGLACRVDCGFERRGCEMNGGGWCGDNELNGPELCDGTTNKTCIAIGFDAGGLTCNELCGFTIRDCTRFGWNPEALDGLVALAVGGTSGDDQWAVGDGGRVMRYEGAFWNRVLTPVDNPLQAVSAVSRDDAWIVGIATENPARPAVLLRWNGVAWNKVMSAPVADYVDVWAGAADRVYVASRDQGIQFWDGTAWGELGAVSGTPIAIRGVTVGGVDTVYVATDEGPLWRWNGVTWVAAAPTNARLRFLDVNAPDDVWGVGSDDISPSNGVIAHWNGATWETWRANGEIYNNIASSGPSDAWVAGADNTMNHYDGVAWTKTLPIGASPSGLAAVSGFASFGANEVIAVSTLSIAYRYRGMAYGRFAQLPTFDQNLAMWSSNPNDLYVTNVKGEIWHLTGSTWTREYTIPETGTNQPVLAGTIWGSGSDDIYVGTRDGRVVFWEGTRWAEDQAFSASMVAIDIVWGTGRGDVWAFSSAGAFHKVGATWTRHVLSGADVTSVSGTGPEDIWAVTRDATPKLWHWDGTAWSEVNHTISRPITAVVAAAPDSVFVAALDGRIGHWSGTTWTEDIVPALAKITFMAASARDDVIAASERELFHHDGRTWSPMRPPIDFVPNTPDYVPMIGIQVTPGRIDMLLERLKVRTLIRTRPVACRSLEAGNCSNGIDDDCDGALDTADAECP
ncbi:MAG: hypothetical protein SFX73_36405 [Kofleriaceae bacterium]|nr:hypothetical protein [Kofleriaceae bacterium]